MSPPVNIDLPVESQSPLTGLDKTQKLCSYGNPAILDDYDPDKYVNITNDLDFQNQLKMLNLIQDSKNLTQIDELTDS